MTGDTLAGRTDEQLVALALGQPGGPVARDAVAELLGRHDRRVYLWCRRYVRDPERALELAQDVLLRAYRSLASFEGRSRFTSWLFVIARNRCLSAVAAPALLADEDLLEEVADPAPDPEARLVAIEDEERLRRLMMEHLDEQEREALWLRCFERVPVDEIGRVMRLENATGARGLLQRARRKLRRVLVETGRGVGS